MKKKALLSSVLTIALCLSLIAGSTFALFTSKSDVNVAVTSGTVNVTAIMKNLELYSPKTVSNGAVTDATNVASENAFANGGTAVSDGNTLKLDRVTPGDKVSFDLVIKNNSNVSVQYRTVIQKIADGGLWSGLNVTFDEEKFDGVLAKKSAWTPLEPDCDDVTVKVVIELPVTAGNEYQGKTCSLSYTVEAAQGNAEMPSEWDGNNENIEADKPEQKEDGFYHITTAAEFINYINAVGRPVAGTYTSVKAVLDKDIDLNGYEFVRSGEAYMFCGHFDGQNHTVSNYKITRTDGKLYTGLFGYLGKGDNNKAGCVENLTVKNAIVTSNGAQTSAIVPSVNDDSTVSNCHAINCTVSGEKKVAAVVGYAENADVKNCSATNCTVYASDEREDQAGAVLGYENINCNVENLTDTGCNVYSGATPIAGGVVQKGNTYEISTAEGLKYVADNFNTNETTRGKTFKLIADIDMAGINWTPWCNVDAPFCGTFDGQNHTVKNLTVNDTVNAKDHATAFIGWIYNGAVKNVNFDKATVSGYHCVAVAVGYIDFGGVMENIRVTNSEVTATHFDDEACGDKAGAVLGMASGSVSENNVKKCSAENCTVKAARDAGQVVGAAKSSQVSDCTAANVTVSEIENSECIKDGVSIAGTNVNNNVIGRSL